MGAQPWLGASPPCPGGIPDEVLQALGRDVGDAVCLVEESVGNTCCLVLSKKPQIFPRTMPRHEPENTQCACG
nr:hypothetical protein [Pseudomonas fluorescens]